MENSVTNLLASLNEAGFTEHIYGTPGCWYHNGSLLEHATSKLSFIYDDNDQRIYVAAVTSVCGTIKGAAVFQ